MRWCRCKDLEGDDGRREPRHHARRPSSEGHACGAPLRCVGSAGWAPLGGVGARWVRERATSRRESRQHFLRACVEVQADLEQRRILSVEELAIEMGRSQESIKREGRRLERKGLVIWSEEGFALTESGLEDGLFVVKSHRLWEHYLYYREILDADHVDRPADEVEHLLTPAIIARLEEILVRERGIDIDQIVNLHGTGSRYRPGGR